MICKSQIIFKTLDFFNLSNCILVYLLAPLYYLEFNSPSVMEGFMYVK